MNRKPKKKMVDNKNRWQTRDMDHFALAVFD